MKNLKEIYNSKCDIKDSQIPQKWKISFKNFMIGSACMAETNEDGSVKEYIYFYRDFRIWYNQNKLAIERDIKIDEII